MVRGLRNNNPGNIRLPKNLKDTKKIWKGEVRPSKDKSFCTFSSMAYGYRALIRTLQTYGRKHGCRAIPDYIRRWAPENENDTTSYIKSVCTQMQITTYHIIDVDDKATMCAMAAAISCHENGKYADMKDVELGWDLL